MAVDDPNPEPAPDKEREARASTETAAGLSCAECGALIASFVQGGMGSAERDRMLGHIKACGDCTAIYGQSLRSAASLGRTRRERRLEEQALVRRETHREMALSATGRGRPRTRFHQLRLVLLPALFALLVIQFTNLPERGTHIQWERGEVLAAGATLGSDHSDVRIGRGTWCQTGPDSEARLESAGSVLRLGSRTVLRVESAAGPPRVRLQAGHLVVQGEATVSTLVGVIESGAATSGRLAWEDDAFVVTCDRGAFSYSGPLGSETVRAGSVRTFEGLR